MIVTEKQAREKWCAEAQAKIVPGLSANTLDRNYDACCIASDCMHWQWESDRRRASRSAAVRGRRGYCGLSGVPE